jgi:hypothetical protein
MGRLWFECTMHLCSALMSLDARKWEHHWPVDELYTCRRTLPLRMLLRQSTRNEVASPPQDERER